MEVRGGITKLGIRRSLALIVLIVSLTLAVTPWVLLPDTVVGGGEGVLTMSFEEQRALLEKLGVRSGDVPLYVIADSRCPWCALQLSFFEREYRGRYGYCYIDRDARCFEVLVDLARRSVGVVGGVPTTLVIRDNCITAIVTGLVEDRTFWDSLLELKPSENIPINPTGVDTMVKAKITLSLVSLASGLLVALLLFRSSKRG